MDLCWCGVLSWRQGRHLFAGLQGLLAPLEGPGEGSEVPLGLHSARLWRWSGGRAPVGQVSHCWSADRLMHTGARTTHTLRPTILEQDDLYFSRIVIFFSIYPIVEVGGV